MNDSPPAGEQSTDSPTADGRRGPAVRGALAGTAVILVLAGVFVGVRNAGPQSRAAAPAPPSPPASAATTQGGTPAGAIPTPAALSARPTVKPGGARNLSGLAVRTMIRGTGRKVRTGQLVTVNYVLARYRTGEELDASWDTGRPLPPFRIGSGAVIEGFDRGLLGVPVGSRVRLDVPARLAYGDPAPPGRPSGDLRFIVDILAAR
ncbi:MAG TPA: FKBP-type peptidyl-prolyl cis-trans isomerase [Actinoplanes sp.]